MGEIYKNKLIINQRGASIDIDSTTDVEKVHISHRSGSNINMNNVVNSELATNNKQVTIVNDSFKTVGNDDTEFVAKNKTIRVGESSFTIKGVSDQSQLDSIISWKDSYRPISKLNGKFKIKRGGKSYPNGDNTEQSGERASNPVLKNEIVSVENSFQGYSGVPDRKWGTDDVATYSKVRGRSSQQAASKRTITAQDIEKSAGKNGSSAPGVLKYGAEKSAATEEGEWESSNVKLDEAILETQSQLTPLEQKMGNGGDDVTFIKRNKIETVGATFNDYPSIRIDEEGRSQPFEVLVSNKGTFKNHDSIPHVEEIDNGNFPGGEKTDLINNRWNVNVGSGGINIKTTGCVETGGATLKGAFKKINLAGSHGLHLASEHVIELASIKSIVLRTNRQVYVEGALGVQGNLVVGGGSYVEGETYIQHITAPLEVQQTEDTRLWGKFATDRENTLQIGWAHFGGMRYPVTALPTPDLIITPPHSHHYNGIPMRLVKSNSDVRDLASNEGINRHNYKVQSLAQNHGKKTA